MSPPSDLLVLGGGPGGSAAAITAAAAGLEVVLLEEMIFPRHRPGETLHPGVEPLFEHLGVGAAVRTAAFVRHPGHVVSWAGAPRFVPYGADARGRWCGFQAWRSELDQILLTRAAAAGATVVTACRPVRARRVDAATIRIESDVGTWQPRFVIDATGQRRWLARELGLRVVQHGPRRTVWYGYVNGDPRRQPDLPALVGGRDGWTWTAPVRPGIYHWTRLWRDDRRPPPDFVPRSLRGLAVHMPRRGAPAGCEVLAAPAGPGYFAVGDAAAMLDPLCGHGVLRALMSGVLAAHLVANVRVGACGAAAAAASYATWLHAWVRRDAARLRALYGVLQAASARPRSAARQPGRWTSSSLMPSGSAKNTA